MADTVDREGSGDWRSVDGVGGEAVKVGLHRARGRARDRRKRERGWTGGEGGNADGQVQGALLAVEQSGLPAGEYRLRSIFGPELSLDLALEEAGGFSSFPSFQVPGYATLIFELSKPD